MRSINKRKALEVIEESQKLFEANQERAIDDEPKSIYSKKSSNYIDNIYNQFMRSRDEPAAQFDSESELVLGRLLYIAAEEEQFNESEGCQELYDFIINTIRMASNLAPKEIRLEDCILTDFQSWFANSGSGASKMEALVKEITSYSSRPA